MRSRWLAVLLFALVAAWSPAANAFVGVVVGRGGSVPESPATTVVLMREGHQVVVSVRAEYRGPAQDFALVLPVPPSVGRDGVRTLRPDAFERIERLAAPRLVVLRERDPCATGAPVGRFPWVGPGRLRRAVLPPSPEARFGTDPYDVTILAVDDAADLARWLRQRGYRAPDGLERAVRPYLQSGYRFLIARVDASRLSFVDGRAVLAPLRFHYRSDRVVLPVRLARANGDRPHDLVVYVLARERMESANRQDVLVPTNLVALPPARERMGEVYATILDRVFRRHPDAVVTEYSWNAAQCDPCPTQPLTPTDLRTFGADVIGGTGRGGFVLTRLHEWIDRPPTSDLALEEGPPVAGGRGRPQSADRLQEWIDRRAEENAFQARYAILRPWRGPVSCAAPESGRWGPPPWRRRVITAPAVTRIIPTGRLRRYLHSWAPVLRIPVRGDAVRTPSPNGTAAR